MRNIAHRPRTPDFAVRYLWYRASDLQQGAPPQRKNVFVPVGALMVRPTDNLMAYVSYTRGFEAGEYAPYTANNANEPTDAIRAEQVEIGLKADINQKVNLGVALFDIRRDASYLNTANDFVSSGRFQHRGVEFTATARATRSLTLVGSRPVDAQNSGFVPGYLVWDAGVSYQTTVGGAATTLRLYAKNLSNKYYYPSVYYQGGLQVGRGREVFLSASLKF